MGEIIHCYTTASTTAETNVEIGDTENTNNIDMDKSITVICNTQKHGEFSITPNDQLGNNPEQIAYGCPKCGEAKSNYVIKTISQNDKNINNYFNNAITIVNYDNNSVVALRIGIDFYKSNTFYVNPLIGMNNISIKEIDNITAKLLKIFPDTPNALLKFQQLMSDGQIWSNQYAVSLEDYAVCEIDGYIITFHLDINNGLGHTINNILPISSVVMKKNLVPYQFNSIVGK